MTIPACTPRQAPGRDAGRRGAREELFRFQRRLARQIERDLAETGGRLPAGLRRYYLEYLRDVSSYQAVVTRRELLEAAARARIVLGGDYHSFDQSKKTHVRILRRLARRDRPVVLALECIAADHQDELLEYVGGTLPESDLLHRIGYGSSWGFDWSPYRQLLDTAREHGLAVAAVDLPRDARRRDLSTRDRFMADMVAAAARDHADAVVYLVVGDWHLARGHLPQALRRRHRDVAPLLIVHQNADSIYWRLAAKGLEQSAEVVRIRARTYCVVNATPLVKLASQALWEGRRADATSLAREGARRGTSRTMPWLDGPTADAEADTDVDLSDTISLFARAISDLFELRVTVDFTLFTAGDAEILPRLIVELADRGPEFFHEIGVLMYYGRSFYVPALRAIYLGGPTINQMADVASTYVYHAASGADALPARPADAFYTRVLRETLTFLGARTINPKRPHQRRADYESVARAGRGRRLQGAPRERLLVARGYLRHRQIEKRMLGGGRRPPSTLSLFHLKPVLRWGLTRGLGQALGHKLHQALLEGVVSNDEVEALYRGDWLDADAALDRYLALVRRTRHLPTTVRRRDQRL